MVTEYIAQHRIFQGSLATIIWYDYYWRLLVKVIVKIKSQNQRRGKNRIALSEKQV